MYTTVSIMRSRKTQRNSRSLWRLRSGFASDEKRDSVKTTRTILLNEPKTTTDDHHKITAIRPKTESSPKVSAPLTQIAFVSAIALKYRDPDSDEECKMGTKDSILVKCVSSHSLLTRCNFPRM